MGSGLPGYVGCRVFVSTGSGLPGYAGCRVMSIYGPRTLRLCRVPSLDTCRVPSPDMSRVPQVFRHGARATVDIGSRFSSLTGPAHQPLSGPAYAVTSGPVYSLRTGSASRDCHYISPELILFHQTPPCNAHRAVLDGEKSGPGKRVRGIGAAACARHGCFCPSSVVDFPRGEKQMSMDYCISETVKTTNTEPLQKMALIYDVICEYGIHMDSRFLDHPGLSLPEGLEVIKAIGLFHVHGHISECLHRYATTYIPFLGVIDGEILETLWAVINKIARSICGATIAHRTEVLDDHMGDSNWKKTINIGKGDFDFA